MGDAAIGYRRRCWYCGQVLGGTGGGSNCSPNQRTVDHQVPLSRGGLNVPENRVLACRLCNTRKGTKLVKEFREYLHELTPVAQARRSLEELLGAWNGEPPAAIAAALEWLVRNDEPIVFYGEQR